MDTPKITNPVFGVNQTQVPQTSKSSQIDQVGKGFKEILDSLNQSQGNSDDMIKKLAAGEDVDVHQVMLAFEEADTNFRVSMAIRDRLVDAYQQVSRMQV
ncbi:MAG: flagellar hook-basal body complex protein FliE [Chloroflexota bacterium]|jgi:flagellar hook-basal body complex protein FliE